MKLVKNPVEVCRAVNDLLNKPTVEDLIAEAEALIYEIDMRVEKFADVDARQVSLVKRDLVHRLSLLKVVQKHERARRR